MASCSFANYCAKKGHDVAIMALFGQEKHRIEMNPLVKIYEPTFSNGKGILGKIIYHIRLMSFIRRNTGDFKPDAVVAHGGIDT